MIVSAKLCTGCKVGGKAYSPDKRARDGLQSRCTECCTAKNMERYRANIEASREERREYYAANHQRMLANNAKSRAKHRPAVLKGKRDYYQRVKSTQGYQDKSLAQRAAKVAWKRAYDTEYRARNPGAAAARAKAWRTANPDKRAAIVRTYVAKRRGWEAIGISGGVLADWTAEQPKVCFYCDCACAENFHVDHFMPLAKGGAHVLTNLRIACAPCNHRKNAKLPDRWIEEISMAQAA